MNPIVPGQREYIRSHPVVFCLSIGIALVGLVYLLLPSWTPESAISILLPEWLKLVWAATWFLGGLASTYGIARGVPRIEGGGMALLASGLYSNFVATIYVRPSAAGAAVFVFLLAIGCTLRAHYLATRGYR